MACRRERGQSLVALVATDAGSFHTTIEAHLGAPTSTDLVLAALPAGIILPWFAAERFPAGFVLCDGTGGLPDLVDRFPLGTADARDVGSETGGATHEHRLTHLTTGRARSGEGGASDGWSATGMDRVGRPQTTGLDHAHGIQGGKAMEASSLPPSTRVMFICKS
jgi:hypothetical protein